MLLVVGLENKLPAKLGKLTWQTVGGNYGFALAASVACGLRKMVILSIIRDDMLCMFVLACEVNLL